MREYKISINSYKDCIIKTDQNNTEVLFRCCGLDRYLFSVQDFNELLPIARLILLSAKERHDESVSGGNTQG